MTMTSTGLSFGAVTAAEPRNTAVSPAKPNGAADTFLAYMKQSATERMQEAWLKSHGLSKEKLAAMSPEQRAATLKQMAKEIQDEIAQAARSEPKKPAGV